MARGGLSSDPVKRQRQLDGLRRGNERAKARLDELGSQADVDPAAATDAEPAIEPGNRRVPVGKVELPKPGNRAVKPKPVSQAKKPRQPGKAEPKPEPASEPGRDEREPGWRPPRHSLSLPFGGEG